MMMTKVWPIATASSGQTLESWLLRLRGTGEVGKDDRHHGEIGDRQIEDEVFGKQQAARQAGGTTKCRPLRCIRETALENGLICHKRFPL